MRLAWIIKTSSDKFSLPPWTATRDDSQRRHMFGKWSSSLIVLVAAIYVRTCRAANNKKLFSLRWKQIWYSVYYLRAFIIFRDREEKSNVNYDFAQNCLQTKRNSSAKTRASDTARETCVDVVLSVTVIICRDPINFIFLMLLPTMFGCGIKSSWSAQRRDTITFLKHFSSYAITRECSSRDGKFIQVS